MQIASPLLCRRRNNVGVIESTSIQRGKKRWLVDVDSTFVKPTRKNVFFVFSQYLQDLEVVGERLTKEASSFEEIEQEKYMDCQTSLTEDMPKEYKWGLSEL